MRLISLIGILPICAMIVMWAAIVGAAADPMVPSGDAGETATANSMTEQSGRRGQTFRNPPEIASENGALGDADRRAGGTQPSPAQDVHVSRPLQRPLHPAGAARAAGRHG